MTKIKDTILERIKSGTIAAKPRWHYVLKTVSLSSGLLLVALMAVYVVTLIVFVLRQTGLWWTPHFGFAGIGFFITNSPWLLIMVAAIFFATLYMLIRHFGHTYRLPAIYSLLGLLAVLVASTAVLHYVSFQEYVRDWSNRHEVPGLTPLYRNSVPLPPESIITGTVIGMKGDILRLSTKDGERFVTLLPNTKHPRNFAITVGTGVMVFGPVEDPVTMTAFGIRPLPPDMPQYGM